MSTRKTQHVVMIILAIGFALCAVVGCQPSGTGLEDKPPPQGGPKSAPTSRPPGEVENKNTR